MKKIHKQILVILVTSVFLGLVRFLFINDDYSLIQLVQEKKSFQSNDIENIEDFLLSLTEPELVDVNMAKKLYDNKMASFIDARDYKDFIEGHILEAINIPYDTDENYDVNLLDSLRMLDNNALIIYCSGGGCTLGKDLSYYLYENQEFYSVLYFEEGYPKWQELDFSVKVKEIIVESSDLDQSYNYSTLDIFLCISFAIMIILYLKENFRIYIPLISRLILGFIFIYFSYDKILDPNLFASLINNYDIIPYGLEYSIALFLPWIEMIVGVFLILGIFLESSVVISSFLLIGFILMISQAFIRGKSIDCGCLLSTLNSELVEDKRFYMLKRIIQDLYFLILCLIVKYKDKF